MSVERDNGFGEFAQKSEWSDHFGGLKRKSMRGIVVEVVNLGNDFYQTVVDPDGISHVFRRDFKAKKCTTVLEAKLYAWECAGPFILGPTNQ